VTLSLPRAAVMAAALAIVVFLPALNNRYALDDGPIVERNPAAHSVPAAVAAFTEPYWPAAHAAGLWRPLVIFSFAVDWSLTGGSTRWLHAANVLWHALAAALVVALLWAYLPGAAALAAGLVFAVHPVHVEAVANLVGRAELLAATFAVAAVLLARELRNRRARGEPALHTELLLLAATALALLSKEHAAVTVALILVDDLAVRDPAAPRARVPLRTYTALALLTIGWFIARRAVEGGLSFEQVAPAFFGSGAGGRIATMLPVVFVMVRLLAWPFDLLAEYQPRAVERLEALTLTGAAGALLLVAVAGLAVAAWRGQRALSAGLIMIAIAWGPTANFLFPTGVVIAERTLYLPSVGFALVAAAAFAALAGRTSLRTAQAATLLVVAAFAVRSWTRAPDWKDNRALVLSSILAHPESYKVHQAAARVLVHLGDTAAALREYGVATELYPRDNYLLTELGGVQLESGRAGAAIRSLRRAAALDARWAQTHELLARALLLADSGEAALAAARHAVAAGPVRPGSARMLAAAWVRLGQADSANAAWPAFGRRGGRRFERWLYASATWSATGVPDSARVALDSALAAFPGDTLALRQVREAQAILAAARLR
jgi:protein O-mannosyl-transferase